MGPKTYASDWLDNTADSVDLRKRRAEALNDRIVRRAEWLEPGDRAVILAMFADGYSAAEIARLSGQPVRRVRSRIHRIVTRLGDPRAAYVQQHADSWSKTRRLIGRAVFVHGKSLRETAAQLAMSFYLVRRHREAIEAMYEADMHASRKIAGLRRQGVSW